MRRERLAVNAEVVWQQQQKKKKKKKKAQLQVGSKYTE
jgi:hypothetical protein